MGTTNKKKREESENEKNAKLNIVCHWLWELENNNFTDLYKKDVYESIVNDARTRYNLPDSFSFPYNSAMARINRGSLAGEGAATPLLFIEQEIVDLLLCMSKLKRSLTASESLRLINDLIDGTHIQRELIEWKRKKKMYHKSQDDEGKVGLSYWNGFLRRNSHQISSKIGRKYSVDRSNWTTYLNFRDMYLHIRSVLLEDSKIASKLDVPVWVNQDGDEVQTEDEAFGCKVDIKINRPDMCLVFDEVGCNLSQEGDNANGGERYMCAPDDVPYLSSATKNQHFTCLGLTRLDGQPLMCVVIIAGKKRDLATEVGIDWDKLDDLDDDYLDSCDDYVFFSRQFGQR